MNPMRRAWNDVMLANPVLEDAATRTSMQKRADTGQIEYRSEVPTASGWVVAKTLPNNPAKLVCPT